MSEAPTFRKENQHPLMRNTNRIGAVLDKMNIELPLTNIDEENIFRRARDTTGLDDFWPDYFREALHVLLEAAKSHGQLTWNGRRATRKAILGGLRTRLWAQKAMAEHPDILDQPVLRPLIIIGAPRTGTTLMNHLLSLDPACRPLTMWESFCPTPWKMRRDVKVTRDPRYIGCAVAVWLSKKVVPELRIMHDFGHNVPDECHWLMWPSFVWPPAMILRPFRDWLKSQPEETYDKVYAEYRQSIQMLHWQRPATGHWVLKSPLHSWALPSMMRAVPEASVIHTHRNLREVIPSFCSLGAVLASLYTDSIEPAKMGPAAIEIARDAIDRFTKARKIIDMDRVFDINYADLVAHPVDAVRALYEKFNYEFTPEFEERIVTFASENRPSTRPKHVYTLEQFSLDADEIAETFATYHREFGLEDT